MTARRLLFGHDFTLPSDWLTSAVGFEQFFNELSSVEHQFREESSNYPPHNLKEIEKNLYELELAVAGFSPEQLEIDVEKHTLTIRGKRDDATDAAGSQFIHRGIGMRAFTKTLALAETIVVQNATLEHGLLKIRLERQVPEKDKPRRVTITTPNKRTP